MFGHRRGRLLASGLFLLVLGGGSTWLIWSKPVSFLTFYSLLVIPVALFQLLTAWRGLPRLVVGTDRIMYQTLISTRWAGWDSIGRFEDSTWYNMPVARAPIVGANVSANLTGKKEFSFVGPLDQAWADIMAEVALRQANRSPAIFPTPSSNRLEQRGNRLPWLSFMMIAFFAIVFFIETQFPMASLDIRRHTLMTMGAINHDVIVATGEWTRLATAAVLHRGVDHLVLNCMGLLFTGFILESVVGRVWYLCLFMVSCLLGSLVSFEFSDAMASVSTSAGIMGLLVAALVLSFQMKWRGWILSTSLGFILPATIGVFLEMGDIDPWGQASGALGGLVLAFFLLSIWKDHDHPAPYPKIAASGVAAGLGLLIVGAVVQLVDYPIYRDLRTIPHAETPQDDAAWRSEVRRLISDYPLDLLPHVALASISVTDGSYLEAEREARRSLELADLWHTRAGEHLEQTWQVKTAKVVLAEALFSQGKTDAASIAAQEICADPKAAYLTDSQIRWFQRTKLCP